MPSRKGMEQAMTWLQSKMAERDTLDAINAELTYNVLIDLQKKRKVIGALYHQSYISGKANKLELERTRETLEDLQEQRLAELQEQRREYEIEMLHKAANETFRRYLEDITGGAVK